MTLKDILFNVHNKNIPHRYTTLNNIYININHYMYILYIMLLFNNLKYIID